MIDKTYRGVWFDSKELPPPKKGCYLTWLISDNHEEKYLETTIWNGSFWELTRYGKIRGYKVKYWTHLLPYPSEL